MEKKIFLASIDIDSENLKFEAVLAESRLIALNKIQKKYGERKHWVYISEISPKEAIDLIDQLRKNLPELV